MNRKYLSCVFSRAGRKEQVQRYDTLTARASHDRAVLHGPLCLITTAAAAVPSGEVGEESVKTRV